MKLLNYNELKNLLLEERDKIPLTVPGARYEMNIPQPNKHGESMRGGIRIALRCMERCQPFTLDDLRLHGRWIGKNSPYDVNIHICSECREQVSILGNKLRFCPNCGAKMDLKEGGSDA